ncbi:MAG TPA: hypothetical protein VEK15_30435 [Vicinamibacteria bacterium]|nr:hypothetical protein [Vicinamibacteria bacterium]
MPLRNLNEDFRDLLLAFADGNVEFVIVGAFAVAYHGVPRGTGDMDVFVKASPDNSRRVFGALVRFGAPLESAGVKPEDFETPGMVYQIGQPPRRIDVLTEISGVSFEEAWATRRTTEIQGRSVAFIGRDELLRNKEATGRPKDLADLSRLKKRP